MDSIGRHTGKEVFSHTGVPTLLEQADYQLPSLYTPSAGGIGFF